MKTSTLSLLSLFSPLIAGHAIWQRVSINGADQGLLEGLRAPGVNSPIMDVNSGNMPCGLVTRTSTKVLTIPVGAKVGQQFQHVIGGPQFPNDPDNPIAGSHKGPVMIYLAKVNNAANAGTSGLKWFKIAQEGLNNANGKWGVDTSIAANGWWYFTFPTCIAPGDYLMRIELIALHSAGKVNEAQFYISCANIRVTGAGFYTPADTVSFPGAYKSNDPGIQIMIYQGSIPNNAGRPYTVPGPAPITCPAAPQTTLRTTTAGSQPSTVRDTTMPATTRAVTTAATGGGGGSPLYGQCGGKDWKGATTCAAGTCKATNEWYSQCLP